jgi:hypothetical protein
MHDCQMLKENKCPLAASCSCANGQGVFCIDMRYK